MFEFKFTLKDLVRSVWVFLAAGAAYLVVSPDTTKASLTAAAAAGLVAVKNLLLKDGSTAKG